MFGVVVDLEEYLQFLSEEWLHPKPENWLLLGTSVACARRDPSTPVAIWFDICKLPDASIKVRRGDTWCETLLSGLQELDSLVAWNGPLPLFAVDHFEAMSKSVLTQLSALPLRFADMNVPTQPMVMCGGSYMLIPDGPPNPGSICYPPEDWDALRGAAATAAYAVPAIDPWVDLFFQLLVENGKPTELAEALHAPWLKTAIWDSSRSTGNESPALWRAIVVEFSHRGRLGEWKAKQVLESICTRAISYGESNSRIERMRVGAIELLNDIGAVEEFATLEDHLSLTLQLLLLRPSPERFLEWREDWAAIPPAVWWTGMMLAGYLQGYRSLPAQFRGTPESQRILALKSWQVACDGTAGSWGEVTARKLSWTADKGRILFWADGESWAEHKLGTRGHWFRADYSQPLVLREAESIASQECPGAITSLVTLSNVSVDLIGDGRAKLSSKLNRLDVRGELEFSLGHGVSVRTGLNVAYFRDWLATASIVRRLKRPLTRSGEDRLEAKGSGVLESPSENNIPLALSRPRVISEARRKVILPASARPRGLLVLENFISSEEENVLLKTFDELGWDKVLKRRVQHFGWRYDYRARRVDPSSYLGPLPRWASELAERLLDAKVIADLPDQVIVNNYDGAQGIARHVDCLDCFSGPVVTISLLETWDMVFNRKRKDGTSERFVQALPRLSATVLSDEAREVWTHEIPSRSFEHGLPRVRRISITLRKVARRAV